jgi:hypothetical protein
MHSVNIPLISVIASIRAGPVQRSSVSNVLEIDHARVLFNKPLNQLEVAILCSVVETKLAFRCMPTEEDLKKGIRQCDIEVSSTTYHQYHIW